MMWVHLETLLGLLAVGKLEAVLLLLYFRQIRRFTAGRTSLHMSKRYILLDALGYVNACFKQLSWNF